MTYSVLDLERNHVVAVAASAVLCELRDRHVPGPCHDAVVDPTLLGVDPSRESISVGLEPLELARCGLLPLHQLGAAGPDFGQRLAVRFILLLVSLLQPLDLVQKAQGLLLLTLEGPADHLQLSVHGCFFAHVPDRFHTFLQLGGTYASLFDGQLDSILLEPNLCEPFFETLHVLLQPEHGRIDFLQKRLEALCSQPHRGDFLVQLLEFFQGCTCLWCHERSSLEWTLWVIALHCFSCRRRPVPPQLSSLLAEPSLLHEKAGLFLLVQGIL